MSGTLFHLRLLMAAAFVLAIAQVNPGQQISNQSACHQIAVIGAVKNPQRAQPGIRLLESVTRAGGPNERAGATIQVLHTNCDSSESGDRDSYNLTDVLAGRTNANPVLSTGDIVVVPEADSVLVFGNVLKPQTIVLRSPMTAGTAISMAGGVLKNSNLVIVRISRRWPTGRRETITLSLNAILAADRFLQAWDIMEVSDEFGIFHWPVPSRPTWDPPLRHRGENSGS